MQMGQSEWTDTSAWAITDVYGEIQSASCQALGILGLLPTGRRRNLLQVFPQCYKALVFDIEVALTGWPTGRTLVLRRPGARTASVRYQVSRRIGVERLELFWQLKCDETVNVGRCA